MKLKLIVLLIIGVIILVVLGYWYFIFIPNKMRSKAINLLKEDLEFCEIARDKIDSFSNNGEFWFICNGRPFYSEYKNESVAFEFNGWGFIEEEPEIMEDLDFLEGCKFYDSEPYDGNYKLLFYCNETQGFKLKEFIFDKSSLEMKKGVESDFINYLFEKIKTKYNSFSSCKLSSYDSFYHFSFPEFPVITLIIECPEGRYNLSIDMGTYAVFPPFLVNNLSERKNVETSFKKIYDLPIKNIEIDKDSAKVFSSYKNANLTVIYHLVQGFSNYEVECDYEDCIDIADKFTLFSIDKNNLERISKEAPSLIVKSSKYIFFFYPYPGKIMLIGVKNEMV
jgi:hypothetical protein